MPVDPVYLMTRVGLYLYPLPCPYSTIVVHFDDGSSVSLYMNIMDSTQDCKLPPHVIFTGDSSSATELVPHTFIQSSEVSWHIEAFCLRELGKKYVSHELQTAGRLYSWDAVNAYRQEIFDLMYMAQRKVDNRTMIGDQKLGHWSDEDSTEMTLKLLKIRSHMRDIDAILESMTPHP